MYILRLFEQWIEQCKQIASLLVSSVSIYLYLPCGTVHVHFIKYPAVGD